MSKLSGSSEDQILTKSLGDLAPYAKMYQKLLHMEGMQARMPFEMTIR
jgi:protease-4